QHGNFQRTGNALQNSGDGLVVNRGGRLAQRIKTRRKLIFLELVVRLAGDKHNQRQGNTNKSHVKFCYMSHLDLFLPNPPESPPSLSINFRSASVYKVM